MYNVGIGESVSLFCVVLFIGFFSVFWFLNGSNFCLNYSGCYIKNNVERSIFYNEIRSDMDIDFIDDIGFGNFICIF